MVARLKDESGRVSANTGVPAELVTAMEVFREPR